VDAYTDLKAVTARDEDDGRDYAVSESGGARYIAHVADFPPAFAGWRLFIVVPETALLSSANRLLTESFVISLIILAAAVFLVYSLASRFFEPVRRLAENTRMIRAFRFEEVRPVRSRFLEIQDMDESLLGMKQGLLAFERFVPKELAHQLIESGAEVTPGGEVRELTIFLSGMSGFSSLCRSLPPEGVVEVLTERFEQQTRIILRERGTLDKFLIDTVMAFWGAPVAMDDGPERACRAALTCLRAETSPIPNRNRRYARSPSLFAIHTGPAIVGNIGSASRMNYTAIGENVEFAWKLKQLNRLYGTRILVSGAARQEIVDRFWWRMVDVLPLEDLDMEIELFELIEQRSLPLTADMEDFIKDYEAGLAHVRANEWDAGTAVFESLSRTHPEDGSVALMLHRCQTRDAQRCPEIGPVKDASDFEGNL
jgi:adenylate cyclase